VARIHIAPNDRVAVVGATGSGKTFLSRHLTARAKRLAVADPKGTLYGKWGLDEWGKRTARELAEGDEIRVRIQPPIVDRSEAPDWEPYFWGVYDAGHTMLYIDEVYGVTGKGGKSQALNAIYTRGRELQIGAISCSQRPSWIPLELLSESSWFFCFRLLLDEDRKRMAGLMGPNVLNGIRPGDPYGFYVYHVSWSEAIYVPQLEVRRPRRETVAS
jgi:hypothetical protein